MILLHGLFGGLSNWTNVISHFRFEFDIHVPTLPLHEEHEKDPLDFLVGYLKRYVDDNKIEDVILVGNSLGGHIALLYTHRYPDRVSKLVLSGSSGLYEKLIIGNFPRRHDRNYVKGQVENVFFYPHTATEDLITEVLATLDDRNKCFHIIKTAKKTQRSSVADILPEIHQPVLLLWGSNDKITPPSVAEQFERLLPNATLVYLPKCGHAAMMEQPEQFNETLTEFLRTTA